MANKTIEGTIRSLREVTNRKNGERKMTGVITMMSEFGDKVVITSGPDILEGLNPEDLISIELKNPQKTLKDSLSAKREDLPPAKKEATKKGKK